MDGGDGSEQQAQPQPGNVYRVPERLVRNPADMERWLKSEVSTHTAQLAQLVYLNSVSLSCPDMWCRPTTTWLASYGF